MNRIENAFNNGKALIAFLTAGDPFLDKTEEFILAMANAGADLVEIGIPFSDPVAEGELIQRANIRALSAGTTIDKIFQMVKSVRLKSQIPLVFSTYMNPVFSYGYDGFFRECSLSGIDGVVIADVPFEEKGELLPYSEKYGVDIISLIAPTSEERINMIASSAKGFVYCTASMDTTEPQSEIKSGLQSLITAIKAHTNIPVAVSSDTSAPQQTAELCCYSDGIVVSMVEIIEQYGTNAAERLYEYVRNLKKVLNESR